MWTHSRSTGCGRRSERGGNRPNLPLSPWERETPHSVSARRAVPCPGSSFLCLWRLRGHLPWPVSWPRFLCVSCPGRPGCSLSGGGVPALLKAKGSCRSPEQRLGGAGQPPLSPAAASAAGQQCAGSSVPAASLAASFSVQGCEGLVWLRPRQTHAPSEGKACLAL